MNGCSAHARVEQSEKAAGQETMATCVFVVEDNADLNRDL